MNNKVRVIMQEELNKIEKLEKIGEGACANLYKKNNDVYKILKENSKKLYYTNSLEKLVGIQSNICAFPREVLKDDDGRYVGYIMDYVEGTKIKEIFQDLSFEQLEKSIKDAELDIKDLSKQNIIFDDMHFDNIMWDNEQKSIKIIDTDFFKIAEDVLTDELTKSNLSKFNNQVETIIGIRDGTLAKYLNKSKEYMLFYKEYFKRRLKGETMSSYELIDKIKSIAEKDFETEFTCISEIVEKAQEKVKEYENEELDMENWSEGNDHLLNLLKSCRDNDVPSMYCCAGHGKRKPAYITLKMNEQTIEKIYNIMSKMTQIKGIGFRFSQKEFGKDSSFTVYMNNEKDKDTIMDLISEAMTKKQQRDKLPENFQKVAQISEVFMREEIGFDLEYDIGKVGNSILLENLRFGNSKYIEKSDLKKMGLKSREDMFRNSQYFRNRMNSAKDNNVLNSMLENLSQIYNIEIERPEELALNQKIAKKISSNSFLRRIPFIDRYINSQLNLLPKSTQKLATHFISTKRKKFIDELSNHGECTKISEKIPISFEDRKKENTSNEIIKDDDWNL